MDNGNRRVTGECSAPGRIIIYTKESETRGAAATAMQIKWRDYLGVADKLIYYGWEEKVFRVTTSSDGA